MTSRHHGFKHGNCKSEPQGHWQQLNNPNHFKCDRCGTATRTSVLDLFNPKSPPPERRYDIEDPTPLESVIAGAFPGLITYEHETPALVEAIAQAIRDTFTLETEEVATAILAELGMGSLDGLGEMTLHGEWHWMDLG